MSNVCLRSNVFPRASQSIWRDKFFLGKINDARLLQKIEDDFKKYKSGENIKLFFSESQISIMRSPVTCAFARGIATYGLVGENRKLVCRCPYAADEANRERCGVEWDVCHGRYEAPVMVDLGPESTVDVTQPTPEPAPLPPAPASDEHGESEPKGVEVPPKQQSEEIKPIAGGKVAYPDSLSMSCCGYDIKGEKVKDGGYEIRISSGGVFVANINSFGVVLGKHPKLEIEESSDEVTLASFDNSEKMGIRLRQVPAPVVEIAIGYTKITVCVK